MKRGKEIESLAVMKIPEGDKKGVVLSLVIDEEAKKVLGFTVKKEGLLRPKRFLSFSSISGIGKDAITIAEDFEFKKMSGELKLLAEANRPIGQKVMTDKGEFIGTITDVIFDEENGSVMGYEVGGGFFKDVMSGKIEMPALEGIEYGKAMVVIPEEMVETLMAGRGIKTLTEEVKSYATIVTEKTKEVIMENEQKMVLGRVSGREISADDGTRIIGVGETIEAEHIEKAKSTNKLHDLALAAGITEAVEGWNVTVKTAKKITGDMLLNKTAGREVLDDEGNEIVSPGKVISEEDIECAKEKGKLSELAASVAKGYFK